MKPDVIPVQRRKLILDLIRSKGVLSVRELASATEVSQPTIRRDLDHLAKAGVVERSHGGAAFKESSGTTHEPEHHVTATMAREEKAAIARLAVDQLKDHQSVIFDSSTTVFEAARLAVERQLRLTVVTNDIRISELFAPCTSVRLIVCGGTIRAGSYSLIGEPGTGFLQNLKVDVALMGIHALNGTSCYDTSLEISSIKRHMVAAAKKVLILADSSKFGQVAFFQAFEIDRRAEIISDCLPSSAMRQALKKKGAVLRCCRRNGSDDNSDDSITTYEEKLN